MKLSQGIKKLALAAAVGAVTTGAIAATQGDLGATSQGEFDVTYNQNTKVRLWGLGDISLNENKLTATVDVCTFNNNTDHVLFTATSSNGFKLKTDASTVGDTSEIDYTLKLNNKGVPADGNEWGEGALPSGQQGYFQFASQGKGADQTAIDAAENSVACGAGTASNTTDLTVTIPTAPTGVGDGAYTDTVTLLIQPI